MAEIKFTDLDKEEQKLLDEAGRALVNAYNPYNSQMRIGAAIKIKTGEIIIGSSLANVSSTVNLCAERVAIGTANTRGLREITA